jgi:four helix bundle protein
MSTFKRFEDIDAWKGARQLTSMIYDVSASGSFTRDRGLQDQIRRAAVSIMANIAEGFERGGRKEFIQFLSIAKSSLGEVKSHLYVALDSKYIDQAQFDAAFHAADHVGSLIYD